MQGTRALGETASSRTRVGNIQDEHIVMPENKGSALKKKKPTVMGVCQRDIGAN